MEKYGRSAQATDNNTAHALCMCGYLRLQTHTQKMTYLLLFHCKRGYAKEPQCYHVRTLPVLRADNAIGESCFFLLLFPAVQNHN